MDKRYADEGQTLVELALVLPCFCLGIFMGVQLIRYCHNMVEFQRMATLDIERANPEHYVKKRKHFLFDSLFGRSTAPTSVFQSIVPAPWRPFRGLSTIQNPGQIIKVKVQSDLFPSGGFMRVLPHVMQSANAETLWETTIREKN